MPTDFIRIGLITKAHGLRGEMNILPLTDDPSRFSNLEDVFIISDKSINPFKSKVISVKYFKNKVILGIEGVSDPETVIKYKNSYIAVDRKNAVKLPENSYFICDIIGLTVIDESGEQIGTVEDILQTGANDVYIVNRENQKDLLIPAISDVICNVDMENKTIVVNLPEGLEELYN